MTAQHDRQDSLDQVRHVVILMQENRSFDHYFGTLRGVRGFEDPAALTLAGGHSVLSQPDPRQPGGDGRLLPYRLHIGQARVRYTTGTEAGDASLPHDWDTGHQAANAGKWDRWVAAKGPGTMGYFAREDIPYHHALADAFTLADHYFCSMTGPTDPNRLYLWSGTAGPGRDGTTGPFTDNSVVTGNPLADWTSYAERLHAAGVSWRVYHSPGMDPELGDYDCNGLSYFKQFHAFAEHDPRYVNAMTPFDLSVFASHCENATLPTVSWLVPPFNYCEHPDATPAYGAHYIDTVLRCLTSNPEVWRHTVFLVMYDENDGFFDHVVPPIPEPGTPDEFAPDGQATGLGPRVPLWVISPWSRGGHVSSQVFDHTSVLRFLERVTGVVEPNISAWRRAVCGDLTSCFDFGHTDLSLPDLPDTKALVQAADAAEALPAAHPPAACAGVVPRQEPGTRPHRPLPYGPQANVRVDADGIVCTLGNNGSVAFPYTVHPADTSRLDVTPFTVPPGGTREYRCPSEALGGAYDLSVHGPDGFLHRFTGRVDAHYAGAELHITWHEDFCHAVVHNLGALPLTVTDRTGTTERERRQRVEPGAMAVLRLSHTSRYDLHVHADDPAKLDHHYLGTFHQPTPAPADRLPATTGPAVPRARVGEVAPKELMPARLTDGPSTTEN